jgi:hypothetical protein
MKRLLAVALLLVGFCAQAQIRPPPFMGGGIPGLAQSQAIFMQRQQSRTLLYREALEELRKNPAAADLPSCTPRSQGPCLATTTTAPVLAVTPPTPTAAPAPTAVPPAPTFPPPKVGRRVALLVGNNDYRMPIPTLETPIADVTSIAGMMQSRFGYETRIVKNAGQAEIIDALNKVAAEIKPEDSVLLFYGGHGYLMEDIGMGFWIPTDASVKTAKGWISNKDIAKLLAEIKAHQLILISDSCYSGTLTKEDKVSLDSTAKPEEMIKRRSVVVFSSGGDEPVSDEGKDGHSIFAYNLIKTLEATGSITAGAQIWKTVHRDVTKTYPQQPQYGAVISAGHVTGGDYLFQPK